MGYHGITHSARPGENTVTGNISRGITPPLRFRLLVRLEGGRRSTFSVAWSGGGPANTVPRKEIAVI